MGIILGLTAAICWGIADFLARYATRLVGTYCTLFFMHLVGFVSLTLYLVGTGQLGQLSQHTSWQPWVWALLAALLNTISSLALYRAFEKGSLSIVSPIAASCAVLTVILTGLSGEMISQTHSIGISIVLVGVVLTATSFMPITKATVSQRRLYRQPVTEDLGHTRTRLLDYAGVGQESQSLSLMQRQSADRPTRLLDYALAREEPHVQPTTGYLRYRQPEPTTGRLGYQGRTRLLDYATQPLASGAQSSGIASHGRTRLLDYATAVQQPELTKTSTMIYENRREPMQLQLRPITEQLPVERTRLLDYAVLSQTQQQQIEPIIEQKRGLARGVGWAFVASIGYGASFWLLGYRVAPALGSVTPVWFIYLTTLCILALCARPMRQSIRLPRGHMRAWWLIAGIGILDTIAFIANNLGFLVGQVSIVSVLASLFSAVTVMLAWLFLQEKLQWNQWCGIILIFIGVALVSL